MSKETSDVQALKTGFTQSGAAEPAALKKTDISQHHSRVLWLAKVAVLSAIAFVLMLLDFSLPILIPGFLKFDFSEIAALLAAFSMGPVAGIAVELIKNVLHLPFTSTMMVGELANFLVGSVFVFTAGLIYKRHKDKKHAILGMVYGVLAFTVFGALFNYFINIPFYINVMGFPENAIIKMSNAVGNKMVHDLTSLIIWVFVPFNLFKGIVISILVGLMYKKVSPLLHQK